MYLINLYIYKDLLKSFEIITILMKLLMEHLYLHQKKYILHRMNVIRRLLQIY